MRKEEFDKHSEKGDWHSLDRKEAVSVLDSSEEGLSFEEVKHRTKIFGRNELKVKLEIHPLPILLGQFNSVLIWILLAAAVFSFFIQHYIDFVVIFVILVINAVVGFLQQYKAEKTILKMRKLLVSNVKVVREGRYAEIPSADLVPGDIVILSEGDKVMADCRVIFENDLQTNESVLTGESLPQDKSSEKLSLERALADRKNMVYMGTSVVRGNGKAIVVSTDMKTEFGKIAKMVQKFKIEKTPLEKKLDSFSKRVAGIVVIFAIITTIVGLLRGEELFTMILTGISVAVAVIPEGLPATIMITLAFAISRMKKHNALIRKLPAAETLGRTTVICVDKTGTLTEEKMTVTSVYAGKHIYEINGKSFLFKGKKVLASKIKDLAVVLRVGIMCNNARIEKADGLSLLGDPTEKALVMSAEKADVFKKEETEREARVVEYSFTSKRKMMAIVRKGARQLTSYVKGAPDIILKKCSKELINGRVVEITKERRGELISIYEEMASNALRVLGFGFRYVPAKFNQEIAERELIFVGFQGMMDPPRKEVYNAIKNCLTAGIKVKMITGDSLLTAEAVSNMIGLDGGSIDASEMEKLSEDEFDRCVKEKTVFARITPELKFRIVQTLKRHREVVAVTGDGVNDVLALKEAHIGVAMGIRGTDVAREASDIVLVDDNFASVVNAVREGRRVYDNLKKSIKFHLSANFGELLLVLCALIFALPLPLLPLAILWMNLITDSLPSLSLALEPEEKDIMHRKPRDPEESILERIWTFVALAGVISFIASITLFLVFYQKDLEKARTIALTTCVFSELFLVFTCRSKKRNIWEIGLFSNKYVLYSVLIATGLQLIAIYTPLAAAFGLKAISFGELALSVGVSASAFVFFEVMKVVKKIKKNSK